MNLTRFEEFVSQQRCDISFKPDVPPNEILERLRKVAEKAPSTLRANPSRCIVVKEKKGAIIQASWMAPEAKTAPIFVAFIGDRNVSLAHENLSKESADLLFSHKPFGLGWLCKALFTLIMRLFSPIPELPAVHKRAWLYKEISLYAMSFKFAAEAAGLTVMPICFFDETRVRKALGLSRRFVIPHLFAVGYAR